MKREKKWVGLTQRKQPLDSLNTAFLGSDLSSPRSPTPCQHQAVRRGTGSVASFRASSSKRGEVRGMVEALSVNVTPTTGLRWDGDGT